VLAPVLTGFMAKYSEVEVALDITNGDVDLIGEGYDLALRIVRNMPSSNLVTRSFNLNQHMLVASPALIARFGKPEVPDDLRTLPALGGAHPPERGGRYVWHLTGPGGEIQSILYRPRLVTEEICVIREMALAGCGVVELPPLFCRNDLSAGNLVQLLPDWSLPMLKLHAVYPSRRGTTLALRTFLDYLSNHLRPWIDNALNGSLLARMQVQAGIAGNAVM
jgi:DNA-binding transcriptional LysR family regulator